MFIMSLCTYVLEIVNVFMENLFIQLYNVCVICSQSDI